MKTRYPKREWDFISYLEHYMVTWVDCWEQPTHHLVEYHARAWSFTNEFKYLIRQNLFFFKSTKITIAYIANKEKRKWTSLFNKKYIRNFLYLLKFFQPLSSMLLMSLTIKLSWYWLKIKKRKPLIKFTGTDIWS